MRNTPKGYFEGWYYKHQKDDRTLAVIPGRTDDFAFIQVITEERSYNVQYDLAEYQRAGEAVRIGASEFSVDGVCLNVNSDGIFLKGELRYGKTAQIRGDIMGPFRFFPMECRHGIHSMLHRVDGSVLLNGKSVDFTGGKGYIESDSGRSFPEKYMWVHCNDFAEDCSIVASVARIPFAGLHFLGCIAVVWLDGREFRLASYRGAKNVRCDKNRLTLKQGKLQLDVKIESNTENRLYAPDKGAMSRTIYESASCPASFCFLASDTVLFQGASTQASYEYVME